MTNSTPTPFRDAEPESSTTDHRPTITAAKDWLIAAALILGTLAALLPNLGAPGITWDEAYPNFPASKSQAEWLRGVVSLEAPFSKETIDAYWETTSDHPSLPRTLAAFSYLLFSGWMDEIVALRLPSAAIFSLLVGALYLFLRLYLSRAGALAGALSLVLMPRVFGHAHFYSLDIPIMAWWFFAAAAGLAAVNGWLRPWWFGAAFAIAFTTKLHSVFLPGPLLMWAILRIVLSRNNDAAVWKRLGWAIAWAALLTPLLYIGAQPWLWHDTIPRIVERFFAYAEKTPIGVYYFGALYRGDAPWHYPLAMLVFTLPPIILGLLLVGIANALLPREGEWRWNDRRGAQIFLIFLFATPLSLFIIPLASAYDGTRLFLPCFPFAAGLVGFGFDTVERRLSRRIPRRVLLAALIALMATPSLWTYATLRPHYLAYYNLLAGGPAGARAMGMETTYWCDSLTREFLDVINDVVPHGATLRPMSMSHAALGYYQDRGWLREDIDLRSQPPYDFHLLQSRQGMFTNVEWTLYLRRRPFATVEAGGVQLFALYGRLDDPGPSLGNQ